MTKRVYFGTDGIRGRVGDAVIHPAFMLKLGFAVGTLLHQKKSQVVIGRDPRISGDTLQSALTEGLLCAGVDVLDMGVMPTPAIAYFTREMHAEMGIVISASHNPYQDNGVKFIDCDGSKLSDEWEQTIENIIQETSAIPNQKIAAETKISNAYERYQQHCLNLFPNVNLNNKKLIVDCANGATSFVAPNLFYSLHAQVIAIHHQPNGYNINDHCGATDIASLRDCVLHEKADVGLAFDGDGDRLLMIDHRGELVDGDEILCILATHQTAVEGVVGTVMSNLGLEQALQARHILFERAAVGDRYVLETMKEKKWILGGEASGHIINLNYSPAGDGLITALQVLQIMKDTKKDLHHLKKIMQKRPQILINVNVENPKRFSDMSVIADAIEKAKSMLNGSGRILLRASGTESCVRVMVECNEAIQAKHIAQALAGVVAGAFGSH